MCQRYQSAPLFQSVYYLLSGMVKGKNGEVEERYPFAVKSAPEGSYAARLFREEGLLEAKLREETEELITLKPIFLLM